MNSFSNILKVQTERYVSSILVDTLSNDVSSASPDCLGGVPTSFDDMFALPSVEVSVVN
jgi:hypothetical protein